MLDPDDLGLLMDLFLAQRAFLPIFSRQDA